MTHQIDFKRIAKESAIDFFAPILALHRLFRPSGAAAGVRTGPREAPTADPPPDNTQPARRRAPEA